MCSTATDAFLVALFVDVIVQRPASIALLALLLTVAVVAGPVGLAIAQEEPTPTPAGNESAAEATPIDQHDDPRNVSEQGDLGSLSDWLGGHLSGRLEDGMVQLSQGQYDSVEGLVGDEFEGRLAQYVDVAGETNAERDDQAADRIETVADDQRTFSEDVQTYRETLAQYRDARERGDTEAARAHARNLDELADDVQATGGDLRSGYQGISNTTGRNLSEGIAAIDGIVTNVSVTQEEVRETTFVATSITVETNRSTAAFDRPARVRGRLVAANGTALANRSITIAVGERNHTTRTDVDGAFELVYRPVSTSTSAESVPVTYRPRPESVYLPARGNLSLSIDPVAADVTVDSVTDRVAFGEELSVEATVTVDGRPVPAAPVRVAVDGRTLARAETDESGAVQFGPRLPASIEAGEQVVTVVGGSDDQAVTAGSDEEVVVVAETATTATVTTDRVGGALFVRGRLTTADGRPVPDQPVAVAAGAASESVTTNASGWYEISFAGPNIGEAGSRIQVSATFDGTGTNLERASASTSATVPETAANGDGQASAGGVPWHLVGMGLGAVLVLTGLLVAYLRWNRTPDDVEGAPGPVVRSTDAAASNATDAAVWFEAARDALASGDERGAVARAYTATYAHLQARLGIGDDRTPRELLAAVEEGDDAADVDALATVVDTYERMTFAGDTGEGAAEVLDRAERVIGGQDSRPPADD